MKLFFDTDIKDFIINSVYTSKLADELETQLYGDLLKLFFDDFGFLSYLEDFELTADNYGYFRETIKKHFTKEIFEELEQLFI
ncbi:MAG TPA: hypothetical protein PLM93_11175 [Sulfuricurvum sp.]|nr:MAG: hypothetical protein B7X89_12030 [Sulfuricurvum sp. 17-40-25]HQS67734.1 hypothetical protein [Sulfuricurvum sp.]HQT37669.1 hypothetical protein [Sulfuricurvum sp.]